MKYGLFSCKHITIAWPCLHRRGESSVTTDFHRTLVVLTVDSNEHKIALLVGWPSEISAYLTQDSLPKNLI